MGCKSEDGSRAVRKTSSGLEAVAVVGTLELCVVRRVDVSVESLGYRVVSCWLDCP